MATAHDGTAPACVNPRAAWAILLKIRQPRTRDVVSEESPGNRLETIRCRSILTRHLVFEYHAMRPSATSTTAAMAKEFDVVIERDSEGNLIASVPALPGCHTQARSQDELMERIKEAVALCLEENGTDPETLEFVGIQRLRVA